MRQPIRRVALLVVAMAVGVFLSPQAAGATEVIPDLQWPAIDPVYENNDRVTSPQGDFTLGCGTSRQNVTTYSSIGVATRYLPQTSQVDGVNNCIVRPAVDKNGHLYGVPTGGPNMLAYDKNILKWKYPVGCDTTPAVGANGNIYFVNNVRHLIGLSPNLAAGQTQPTKVLDVPVSSPCGSQLRAFKGGIAINGGAYINFYRYDGTQLSYVSGVYTADRKAAINADGRLFFTTQTNNYRELNLTVYDPSTRTEAWTVRVHTTDRPDGRTFRTYPLPGGGALVALKVDDPNSDGTIATLVTVTSSGQVLRTTQLPRKNAEGDLFGADNYYAVDTKGKLVVARSKSENLPSSSIGIVTTEVTVFDTATGNVIYQKEIKGNADPADGDGSEGAVYGYRPIGFNYDIAIGPNAAYIFVEKCWPPNWSSCNSGNYPDKVLPLRIVGLQLDYPRGAVIGEAATPPPSRSEYAALGDSFSSGEGVGPYEEGTNEPGVNLCHRSTRAHSRILEQDRALALNIAEEGFRACAGAKTENILNTPKDGESPQIDYLREQGEKTKVVSLTIGGNDSLFSEFATACVMPGTNCNVYSSAYANSINKINNVLPNALKTTYQRVLAEAPKAQVYVLGYPHVAPERTVADPWDARCPFLHDSGYDPTGTVPQYWGDAQAARDIVGRIDSHIERIIWDMRELGGDNLRLHYVEVNGIGSPFEGHEMCSSGESYFQNLDQWPGNHAAPFHPNEKGQQAYAALLANAIRADRVNDGYTDPDNCGNPEFC